jgi:hypothetical protein
LQARLDWFEESVDMIVDWPADSPNLPPIEVLWAILKELIWRTQPQTIEELKGSLVAASTFLLQFKQPRFQSVPPIRQTEIRK